MKAPDSCNERMSEFQFEQPTEQDNNESKSRKTEKRTLLKKLWAGQKWSYSTDCNDFWRTFECFSSSASTNNKKEPKRKSWKNKAICCRCFSGPNNRPIVRPLNVLMFEVFFFFLSFFLSFFDFLVGLLHKLALVITNWFECRSQKPKRMSDTFHLFLFLSFFLYFPGSAVGVVIVQSHHSIPKNDKTKHTRHTKKENCKKLDSNLIATVAAVWSGGVKVAASGLLPHRNELDANCNHTPLFHCSLASNSLSVFFLLSLSLSWFIGHWQRHLGTIPSLGFGWFIFIFLRSECISDGIDEEREREKKRIRLEIV